MAASPSEGKSLFPEEDRAVGMEAKAVTFTSNAPIA